MPASPAVNIPINETAANMEEVRFPNPRIVSNDSIKNSIRRFNTNPEIARKMPGRIRNLSRQKVAVTRSVPLPALKGVSQPSLY
jgi:hypothetical protein